MSPKSAEEIEGFEYDWLCSDVDGHVALFTTNGAGYAPSAFLDDTNAHDVAIDAILARSACTTVKFAPSFAPDIVNTWLLVAERGLYAFDYDPVGGYQLVAVPTVPMLTSALPADVAHVVAGVRVGFCFEKQTAVSNDLLQKRE